MAFEISLLCYQAPELLGVHVYKHSTEKEK